MGDICGMSSLPISPEQLATLPPDVRAVIEAIVRHYEERIARLEAELQGLRKTPQNSSLPPSTQHPHAKPLKPRSKSKKNHGGQPGHAKHERPLIPTDQCDAVVTLKPNECRRCGTKLSGCDAAPLRHQVYELPEIKPLITEYQQHRLCCPGCGDTTCAALPAGVPRGQSGPKLIAFVALLMACFRQSKRRTALFVTSRQPSVAVLLYCTPSWLAAMFSTTAVMTIETSVSEGTRLKSTTTVLVVLRRVMMSVESRLSGVQLTAGAPTMRKPLGSTSVTVAV